jgi:hypothetical protein
MLGDEEALNERLGSEPIATPTGERPGFGGAYGTSPRSSVGGYSHREPTRSFFHSSYQGGPSCSSFLSFHFPPRTLSMGSIYMD